MPKPILKIALDVPLDRLFDYLSGGASAQIGQRVLVPFGRRSQIGIVMGFAETSEFPIEKLKPVTQVFADELPIDTETLMTSAVANAIYWGRSHLGYDAMKLLPAEKIAEQWWESGEVRK